MLTLFDRIIATEARFSSPPYNNDTEAASQQLLAENSPLRPQPAAVRGANLLNAARALPRSAAVAPQRQTAKAGKLEKPGKLKRVSLPEQRTRKVRGADIYNIEPSPQKRISLSPPVAALEVAEQEDTRFANEIEDVVPETSSAQPNEDRLVEMPESSNVAAEDRDASPLKRKSNQNAASARPSDAASAGIQEEAELSVNRATGKDLHPIREHIAAASANQMIKSPAAKKRKVLRGPKFRDPEAANLEEDVITRSIGEHNAQPNGDPQPEVRIPFRATRLRTAQAEAEKAKDTSATAIIAGSSDRGELTLVGPSRATRSSKPAPKPSRRKISQMEAIPANPTAELTEGDGEDSKEGTRSTGKKQQGVEATNNERVEAQEVAENIESDAQVDIDGAVLASRETASHHSTYLPALDKVFRFANSEDHPGACLTNLGKNIHRACDRSRVMLSQPGDGPSLEDIAKCREDLANLLASVHSKIKAGRMVAFKRDAFGYLFRPLALVLKLMHDKLQELDGDVSNSLRAVQILYPFVCDILHFKDAIDAWKVKVPQREQGERLIRNVKSGLIIHLRGAEILLRMRFVRLRAAEHMRQVRLEEERRWEKQKQELARREESLASRKERRRRWQDLHIFRMQCEPDPTRRHRLRFVEPIEAVETDANGEQFERVPVFGERSMPPPQWTAASSGIQWTTEQEVVLLDALQSSAGKSAKSITLVYLLTANQYSTGENFQTTLLPWWRTAQLHSLRLCGQIGLGTLRMGAAVTAARLGDPRMGQEDSRAAIVLSSVRLLKELESPLH